MKSAATSVAEYLDTLPPERRGPIDAVRKAILRGMDADLRECMQYGVVGYCVPHSVWPHGHHTKPELPLMYMGLSSQKNDMVVYMLFLKDHKAERAWFEKAWKATGRRSRLEIGGMGCCLRFKRAEDLSLEVVTEAMRRVPVKKYLEHHAAVLAKIGKGPGANAWEKPRAVSGSGKRAGTKEQKTLGDGPAQDRERATKKTPRTSRVRRG
ncbi:MAG: hypothetical protein WAZ94_04590 [Phycisphaerales bacterium]